MQRVLMTADTIGGVWTYALELIRSLEEKDVEFALATMGRPLSRVQRRQVEGHRNLEVFESSYRLEWMEDPWRDVRDAGQWLLELEQELRPDLIHLNGYAHASLPWRAPKLVVAHSDVYSWFYAVKRAAPPSDWDHYHDEVAKGLRAADLLIAPSHSVVADVQRHYGFSGQVRVIPNGVSSEVFHEREKENYILTVGRLWDEAKNIGLLEEIAADLSWPVLAAGSTQRAGGKNIEIAGVKLLGELAPQELARYYAHASLYVLPAKYEPFGLSILEAAMSGCTLVLGNIPSLRENWQNAAAFIDPENPEALRDAIEYLIQNSGERLELARKSRQRSRFFGSKRMADAYLREYLHLVRPEPPISQDQYLRGA